MKTISKPLSNFDKDFPKIWFGFLWITLPFIIFGGQAFPGIFMWLALMLAGSFIAKQTVWSVVDEVIEFDDHLLFRKNDLVQKVLFNDILDISPVQSNFYQMIVVTTGKSGPLGCKLTFNVIDGWNPFRYSRISKELKSKAGKD